MVQNINGLENKPNPAVQQTGVSEQQVKNASENISGTTNTLSDQENQKVNEFMRREAEVKAHELAHKITGGQYIRGGINYTYETGPDNKRYITGGEVSIDTSEVQGDPEKTAEKMKTVYRAALAPADPSTQDRRVASEAKQKEMEAQREIVEENAKEIETTTQTENEEIEKNQSMEQSNPFYSNLKQPNHSLNTQNSIINLLA